MRKPYILKADEVDILLAGYVSHGEEVTYERMKQRAFDALAQRGDMDDIFLDMYEGMITKARTVSAEVEENEDVKRLTQDMYALAFMMRNIAHQLYRAYNRSGMARDNDRFLRLVAQNNEIPV